MKEWVEVPASLADTWARVARNAARAGPDLLDEFMSTPR